MTTSREGWKGYKLWKESLTCLDNFLQIPPGFFKSLHSKPSVRVGGYTEALDLAIKLCQLVEVSLGGTQWGAESIVSFSQRFDFFQRVTAHGIRQVLFSVLKPAVEGRRLLGKSQEQILNLDKRKQSSCSVQFRSNTNIPDEWIWN